MKSAIGILLGLCYLSGQVVNPPAGPSVEQSCITVQKTANYTATNTDCTIFVDTTAGDVTITLPANPANRQTHQIKKITAVNTLTISGNGKNIDGSATQTVTTQYQNTTIQFFSNAWWIL